MQIRDEGLAGENGEAAEQQGRVVYVMHPNCAVDEL